MRKVLVFGNSGSGKSTLAKHLADTENLAHFDLDTIAWLPTNPPQRAPVEASFENLKCFFNDHDSWVIEGCYGDLISLTVPYANELIFLNLDTEACIENAKNRPWEPHKYSSMEEQNDNLKMLLGWIAGYNERNDELSCKAHQRIFDEFSGNKTMYTSNPTLK